MYGYDIRLSDEPGDVMHLDMGEPCTDEELEALREYFIALRKSGHFGGSDRPGSAGGMSPTGPGS